MAQPNQPASNHNIQHPDKVKAPLPAELVHSPQEQRMRLAWRRTEPATPKGRSPWATLDPSSILHVDPVRWQAVALQRLNATQGQQTVAQITTTQGNRHSGRIVAPPQDQPKFTVSDPDERYGRQAGQVATQFFPSSLTSKPEHIPAI
jgi:hypothetical protein